MTIGIDANVLVYAHRSETPRHASAVAALERLTRRKRQVAVPWTCIYQFLRVATHPAVFDPPSEIEVAWEFVGDVLAFPDAIVLAETEAHARILDELVTRLRPRGNLVHDVHIAAVLLEHNVHDFLTTDRDFARIPGIRSIGLE